MSCLRIVIMAASVALATQASAHGSRVSPGTPSGIAIPSLSHGEMAIIARYRGRILELAEHVKSTDPTFRTLLNYGAIEFTYCLWGIAPGAITDEESPFNECAHAYLAATKALLIHMRGLATEALVVAPLISEIDSEMVRNGAAFIGCQYSGETFNTSEFVTPHWENLPGHGPSVYALSFLMLLPTIPLIAVRWLRQRTRAQLRDTSVPDR